MSRRSPGHHRAPVLRRRVLVGVWTAVALLCALSGLWVVVAASPEEATAHPPTPLSLAPAIEAAAPPAPALPASPPVRLSIPVLDVTSDVMPLGLEDDGSLQVPPGAYPAGWYRGGATPGEVGPAVLVGHVDWAGEPGVFADIDRLEVGQQIAVEREDGTTATFAVDRVARFPKHAFPTDEVYGPLEHAGLRLITCGGWFDRKTGHYTDNVVVFATLVPPS